MAPLEKQGMARMRRVPNANRRSPDARDTRIYIALASGLCRLRLPAGGRGGACYVRAAVRRRGATLRGATAAFAAVALALAAGCGGGARQDAGERAASYPVAVPLATFPTRQSLAERTEMRIAVRNAGSDTIPNVAATIEAAGRGTTVEAFARHTDEPGVQSSSRPVWVVEAGPYSGEAANANTWALGPLRPGATKTFVWRLAAVEPGRYTLTYRLSGSLSGKSQLRLQGGAVPQGSFTVTIDAKPGRTRVLPDGRIVRVPGS
jgi:hypothetical protein